MGIENLMSGEMKYKDSIKFLESSIVDIENPLMFGKLVLHYKMHRRMDKLRQYLVGQLAMTDSDLLGVDEDGVPLIGPLTKEEKLSGVRGDEVKMFPRYEIMQKKTKRRFCAYS